MESLSLSLSLSLYSGSIRAKLEWGFFTGDYDGYQGRGLRSTGLP
jgi:hypothetical protein